MTARTRNPVVDALKGTAIVAVILLHSFSGEQLRATWSWFHIWQAVPVLAVLLGVTASHTRFSPLSGYYARRARRLLPAFAVGWLVALVLGFLTKNLWWEWTVFLGRLPMPANGAYFVTLLFEWVLVAPLLVRGYRRAPEITVRTAFFVSVAFEVVCWATGVVGYAYASCILRFLFAAALGLWVADGRGVGLVGVLGIGVIVAHALGWNVPVFNSDWQPQSALTAGYAALLVAGAMRYVTRPPAVLVEVGRASYHVFLIQALWFGFRIHVFPGSPGMVVQVLLALAAVVVFPVLGVLWYRLEWRVLSPRRPAAVRPDDF